MEPEKLLKPRYKVLIRYPDSPFQINRIVNGSTFNITGGTKFHYEDYPGVFKKLEWWEEREPEEMPEYVKDAENYRIVYNVHGWLQKNGMFQFAPSDAYITDTKYFIPATKEEYEAKK